MDEDGEARAHESRNVALEAAVALRTVAPSHLIVHAISSRVTQTAGGGGGDEGGYSSSDDASMGSAASEPLYVGSGRPARGVVPNLRSPANSSMVLSPPARRLSNASTSSSLSSITADNNNSPGRSSSSHATTSTFPGKSHSNLDLFDNGTIGGNRSHSTMSLFRDRDGGSAAAASEMDALVDSGPITDIKVMYAGERVPRGYKRATHASSDKKADLNRRGGGKSVYVCFRRGGTMLPVTGICIVREGEHEFVPPGYTMIEKTAGGSHYADLCGNSATAAGSRAFLCFCRGESAPITNICVVYPLLGQVTPAGYCLLERTPMGHSARLNARTKNHMAVLAFSRDLIEVSQLTKIQIYPEDDSESTSQTSGGDAKVRKNIKKSGSVFGFKTGKKSTLNVPSPHSDRLMVIMPSVSTRLEDARDKAIEGASDDVALNPAAHGLGSSGAIFSPEVAALLADPAVLNLVSPLLFACYSGHVGSILVALKFFRKLVLNGFFDGERERRRSPNITEDAQMTLFDFVVKAVVDSTELGYDVVFPPALRFLVSVVERSKMGLHPITMHFVTLAVKRAHCFFEQVDDYNQARKAAEAARVSRAATTKGTFRRQKSSFSPSLRSPSSSTLKAGSMFLTPKSGSSTLRTPPSKHSPSASMQYPGRNVDGASPANPNRAVSYSHINIPELSATDIAYVKSVPKKVFEIVAKRVQREDTWHVASGEKGNDSAAAASTHQFIAEDVIGNLLDRVHRLRMMMGAANDAVGTLARHSHMSPELSLAVNILCSQAVTSVAEQNLVMIMLSMCKEASMPIYDGSQNSRDDYTRQSSTYLNVSLHTKLSGLELLRDFLMTVAKSNKNLCLYNVPFGYLVRRFVVPALLANVSTKLSIIFRALLQILTELWKHYRRHLKTELATILECILLEVLKSPYASPYQKIDVVSCIVSWFDMQPGSLVEIFLNFQNDPPIKVWRTYVSVVEVLCNLGEGAGEDLRGADERSVQAKKALQLRALRALVTLMRSLMDASATAHLILRDTQTGERALIGGEFGWEKSEGGGEKRKAARRSRSSSSDLVPLAGKPSVIARRSSVRCRHELLEKNAKDLEKAFRISKEKGTRKAVRYLVASGYIEETPVSVASLLRLHHQKFGESELGDYLGDGGKDEVEQLFMTNMRVAYTRSLRFAGMSFDKSLRMFLTQAGFRLPGESQKIERLTEAFAHCYYEDNKESFANPDTVLVLAFSTVMLNTDMYNPSVKKKRKMTKEQFIRNLEGCNDGEDISKDILENIFESIERAEIKWKTDAPLSKGGVSRGSAAAGDQDTDPAAIALKFRRAKEEAVRRSLSILSSQRMFCRIHHSKVNSESIALMFECVWHHFYGIVTTILEHSDSFTLEMISLGLDMLRYSISASLFLGMETERRAFATLLAKLHYLHTEHEWDRSREKTMNRDDAVGILRGKHLEQEWFTQIMNASAHDNDVIDVIAQVHHLASSMKERVKHRQTYEELVEIQKRFDNSVQLVDHNRIFIREGSLVKKCRSKDKRYTFFLFSDLFVYASTRFGKLHVHQQLPLRSMRIVDISNKLFVRRNAFDIKSPVKSFVVMADSPEEKIEWVRELTRAISRHNTDRKTTHRFSMVPRLQQQAMLMKELGQEFVGGKTSPSEVTSVSPVALRRKEAASAPIPEFVPADSSGSNKKSSIRVGVGPSPRFLEQEAKRVLEQEAKERSTDEVGASKDGPPSAPKDSTISPLPSPAPLRSSQEKPPTPNHSPPSLDATTAAKMPNSPPAFSTVKGRIQEINQRKSFQEVSPRNKSPSSASSASTNPRPISMGQLHTVCILFCKLFFLPFSSSFCFIFSYLWTRCAFQSPFF